MFNPYDLDRVDELNPEDFEKYIREILAASSHGLQDLNITHREKLEGVDGTYEIDVCARFSAFGADFLVLAECKHHRNAIKRETVQILHSRMQSIGAQKGMIFSTSGFQKGAIDFAKIHGIALIRVTDSASSYVTRTLDHSTNAKPRPWLDLPDHMGWMITSKGEKSVGVCRIDRDLTEYLDDHLAS